MTVTRTVVQTFKTVDEDDNIYRVIEYELITTSDEVRRDGMRECGRITKEFKLESGFSVIQLDSETFKIAHSDKTIWKV